MPSRGTCRTPNSDASGRDIGDARHRLTAPRARPLPEPKVPPESPAGYSNAQLQMYAPHSEPKKRPINVAMKTMDTT